MTLDDLLDLAKNNALTQDLKEDLITRLESVVVHERDKPKKIVICCPYHEEKTGSFCIDQKNKTFHCFGCGKSGHLQIFEENYTGKQAFRALSSLMGVSQDLESLFLANELNCPEIESKLMELFKTIRWALDETIMTRGE